MRLAIGEDACGALFAGDLEQRDGQRRGTFPRASLRNLHLRPYRIAPNVLLSGLQVHSDPTEQGMIMIARKFH